MTSRLPSIAFHGMHLNLDCTIKVRCPKVPPTSEQNSTWSGTENKDIALFLPFSCNESLQHRASRCKAETIEVIEKTKKTGLYG